MHGQALDGYLLWLPGSDLVVIDVLKDFWAPRGAIDDGPSHTSAQLESRLLLTYKKLLTEPCAVTASLSLAMHRNVSSGYAEDGPLREECLSFSSDSPDCMCASQ